MSEYGPLRRGLLAACSPGPSYHGVGDVHRPGIGRHQQSARARSAGSCLRVSLPTRSSTASLGATGASRRGWRRWSRARACCVRRAGHAPALVAGMVGHGRVAFRPPVAQGMAGAGARSPASAGRRRPLCPCPVWASSGTGRSQATSARGRPSGSQKLPMASSTWMPGRSGIRSLMKRPCSSSSATGRSRCAAGPGGRPTTGSPARHLQLQQNVEAPPGQPPAQGTHAGEPGLLVVGDEFDTRQAVEQFLFAPADHPGDRRLGPGLAQGADQRQDVGHIAKRGQAEEADRGGVVSRNC